MRKLSILVAVFVLVAAIIASNFLSGRNNKTEKSEKEKKAATADVIREVAVLKVVNKDINAPVTVTGKLISPEKVDLFAEVSGVLLSGSNSFKEGSRFAKGALLINIDDEESRMNLLAQKSLLFNTLTQMMPDLKLDYPDAYPKWQEYLDNFKIEKPLMQLPEPQTNKEKYFVATKNVYNQFYTIRSQEARQRKYKIFAPFAGVVVASDINPGTLVRQGQKLGEIINPYNYELDASLSVKDLDYIHVGDQVRLFSEDIKGSWNGTIKRISDKIDPATQTLKVFISASGKGLKEGMFLKGEITANQLNNVFEIARGLIVNKNQVFIVENSRLKLQEINIV